MKKTAVAVMTAAGFDNAFWFVAAVTMALWLW
jgi:hypothetical protein